MILRTCNTLFNFISVVSQQKKKNPFLIYLNLMLHQKGNQSHRGEYILEALRGWAFLKMLHSLSQMFKLSTAVYPFSFRYR